MEFHAVFAGRDRFVDLEMNASKSRDLATALTTSPANKVAPRQWYMHYDI